MRVCLLLILAANQFDALTQLCTGWLGQTRWHCGLEPKRAVAQRPGHPMLQAELALQAHEALHAKRQAQDESECALQQANQECAELRRALGDAEERAEAMQAELLTLRPRSATITSEVCSCRPAPPSPIPALRPCDAL